MQKNIHFIIIIMEEQDAHQKIDTMIQHGEHYVSQRKQDINLMDGMMDQPK
jgi:hypothetical protein